MKGRTPTLPPPEGKPVAPPTTCPVYWGAHYGEHQCCLPVEEHYGAPDLHECDCGSEWEVRS